MSKSLTGKSMSQSGKGLKVENEGMDALLFTASDLFFMQ